MSDKKVSIPAFAYMPAPNSITESTGDASDNDSWGSVVRIPQISSRPATQSDGTLLLIEIDKSIFFHSHQ